MNASDIAVGDTVHGRYFDYLFGRVMKVEIPESGEMETWLYDRDNGDGAAEDVIASLRDSDTTNAVISATHQVGKVAASRFSPVNTRRLIAASSAKVPHSRGASLSPRRASPESPIGSPCHRTTGSRHWLSDRPRRGSS